MEYISPHIDKRLSALAVKIREQRLAKKYTQEYVGFKLGISQNAYSKIELGQSMITIKKLFKIAEVLEIDIHVLFGNQR